MCLEELLADRRNRPRLSPRPTLLVTLVYLQRGQQLIDATPHPDQPFMRQVGLTLTAADDALLIGHRVLNCSGAEVDCVGSAAPGHVRPSRSPDRSSRQRERLRTKASCAPSKTNVSVGRFSLGTPLAPDAPPSSFSIIITSGITRGEATDSSTLGVRGQV